MAALSYLIQSIIAFLATYIIAVISWGGYWGIIILMAIESACIPLPSEIIMPFGGYLVSTGELNLYLVATAGAIGCNIGSIPAYELGKRGGRAAIMRWGKYVLLDTYDLELAERFFARFGSLAVLVARMLPIVRSFIALPAGVARMPLPQFHIYTFIGSWPFCFGLAWIGMVLGKAWDNDPRVKAWFHRFDVVIVAAGLVLVGWFLWTRWKRRPR
ncbi:DedA family protein [Sphingomonas sp. ID1715]|uniref:DedA family protein n=1 Tax=Sphingomonas sp. ID1715 TaxID=1656898 RepID=UPI0014887FB2|nr:DedA family protein [Sphingomonas sp. ID1715]NNM76704.1 DedA family protein [Sphingomonas sp. ID1715]